MPPRQLPNGTAPPLPLAVGAVFFGGWWALTAAGGIGFLGFVAVIPGFLVWALPVRNALYISSAQFDLVVGAAWAISNAAALVAGLLADRYGGRQLVLQFGGAIWMLTNGLDGPDAPSELDVPGIHHIGNIRPRCSETGSRPRGLAPLPA